MKIITITLLCLYSFNALSSEKISRLSPVKLPAFDRNIAKLGLFLFDDKRLSKNNSLSCRSCHTDKDGGSDGLPLSIGIDGKPLARNSRTIFNSALNGALLWNGSATNLEDQAHKVLSNPRVMGWNSIDEATNKISKTEGYRERFISAYGSPEITSAKIAEALAAYQSSQTGVNSDFDLFLQKIKKGGKRAINSMAYDGYRNFDSLGCSYCHSGPNMGGSIMQKLGFLSPPPKGFTSECINNECLVPSLRNVVNTPPYFEKGQVKTLREAIKIMGKLQTNFEVNDDIVDSIIEFLKAVPGEIPPLD